MKRKTVMQSTDQPIPVPEDHANAAPVDYAMTMQEGPGVAVPAQGEPRWQTMPAQQPTASQTMVEQPRAAPGRQYRIARSTVRRRGY